MAVKISSQASDSIRAIEVTGESELQAVQIYMTFVNYQMLSQNENGDTVTNSAGGAYATLFVDVNKFTTLKDIHEYMSDLFETTVSMSYI